MVTVRLKLAYKVKCLEKYSNEMVCMAMQSIETNEGNFLNGNKGAPNYRQFDLVAVAGNVNTDRASQVHCGVRSC